MYIKLFDQCEPSSLGGRVLGTTKKMLPILRLGIPKKVKLWFFITVYLRRLISVSLSVL
jgi:hypothetical protein